MKDRGISLFARPCSWHQRLCPKMVSSHLARRAARGKFQCHLTAGTYELKSMNNSRPLPGITFNAMQPNINKRPMDALNLPRYRRKSNV